MSVPPLDTESMTPLLPPMPRRQSCDRCHEQKVRCFTNEQDYVFGPGGTGDADLGQNGQSISAFPCARCKKAKATCIYSPQQRSGRPRLQRDVSSLPSRKRARRTSRASSASSSASPALSLSSSPPPSTFTYSNNLGLGIMNSNHNNHTNFYTPELSKVDSHANPQLSPIGIIPHRNQENHMPREHSATVDDWLMSPFGPGDARFTNAMPQMSSFSSVATLPNAPFLTELNAACATDNAVPGYTMMFPDPVGSYIEELADMTLRIHLATLSLPPLNRTPLSLSSPAVNEIFDATCSLISLVDRYTAEKGAHLTRHQGHPNYLHPHPNVDSGGELSYVPPSMATSPAVQSAMDASTCLMVFACHQGLLGVFEDMCSSFSVYIRELQQPSSPSTVATTAFISSSTTQIIVMVNLISHLLSRLDRSIGSLATSTDPRLPPGYSETEMSEAALSPVSSSSDSSEELDRLPDATGEYDVPGPEFQSQDARPGGQEKAAMSIFRQMEQRQTRARTQVKMVKRLIRRSNVI